MINQPVVLQTALDNQPTDGNPAIECPAPPAPPCLVPDAPSVEPGSQLAQELVLDATIPLEASGQPYPADSAVWLVERRDVVAGQEVWTVVSSHRSTDTIARKTGRSVRFGLPGLARGATFRFRVAYCEDLDPPSQDRTCTCWAAPSSSVTMDGPFSVDGPALPTNIVQEVEDHFERPTTTPVQQGGDGVGPESVWLNDIGPSASEASIDGSAGEARLEPSAQIQYVAAEATDSHTYAEALIRKIPDGKDKYNVNIVARRKLDGTVLKFYVVKLVKGHRGWDDPTLAIGRWDEPIVAGGVPSVTLPTGNGTCTVAPAFESGTPVWLRIEVKNDGQNPAVTGSVIWDDGGVERTCGFERIDTGDAGSMSEVLGNWGVFGDDSYRYAIDVFKAGSEHP